MLHKGVLTEKTVVFTFSIILVLAIWWFFYRSKQKVHVLLHGKSTNPYIRNLIKGITQECEKQNLTLELTLVEDVNEETFKTYHDQITQIQDEYFICRPFNKATIDHISQLQKKCIMISWKEEVPDNSLASQSIVRVIKPPLYIVEDDALVVVPCTDFVKVDTRGGIVSIDNLQGRELDTIYTIAQVYSLKSMYVFGSLSGLNQEFVQKSLRSLFTKVKEIPIPGDAEGSLAIKEFVKVSSPGYTSIMSSS